MNKLFFISLLCVLIAACNTVKKTATNDRKTIDSNRTAQQDVIIKERIVRDTVITVQERIVRDTITQEDASIYSVSTGRKRPVYRQKTENGLTAWVQIDTSSNITYGARADSFVLVVKNLTRERDSFASLYRLAQFRDAVFHSDTNEVKEKVTFGGWLMRNVYWIVPVLVIIAVIIWFLIKNIKFFI